MTRDLNEINIPKNLIDNPSNLENHVKELRNFQKESKYQSENRLSKILKKIKGEAKWKKSNEARKKGMKNV